MNCNFVWEKKQNLAGNDWTFYRPEDIIITYVENYLYSFGYSGTRPFGTGVPAGKIFSILRRNKKNGEKNEDHGW